MGIYTGPSSYNNNNNYGASQIISNNWQAKTDKLQANPYEYISSKPAPELPKLENLEELIKEKKVFKIDRTAPFRKHIPPGKREVNIKPRAFKDKSIASALKMKGDYKRTIEDRFGRFDELDENGKGRRRLQDIQNQRNQLKEEKKHNKASVNRAI
mmetsp:Transcript_24137/g.21203  ORF Transcript_24137/g.21203 Transcript_24137/m.21203 type:complete len:156 (+) Transcript_24137:679-1146(+)